MAMEYQGFATLGVNLNRQKYGPLDVSSVFNSTADLTYYRTKGQTKLEGLSDYWKDIVPYPYEGQIVSLTENGEVSVFKLVANGDVFDAVAIGNGDGSYYEPIDITNLASNLSSAEIGSTVSALSLTWIVNKTPTTQTLTIGNGSPIVLDVADRSWSSSNLNIVGTTKFTLTVTDASDDGNSTDSQTIYLTFYDGIYCGVMEDGVTINSGTIQQYVQDGKLTKKLQSTLDTKFTGTPTSTERLFYAAPTNYGTPVFTIGGMDYEWIKNTIQFTNASDRELSYDVWQSGQVGLDKTTVIVTTREV